MDGVGTQPLSEREVREYFTILKRRTWRHCVKSTNEWMIGFSICAGSCPCVLAFLRVELLSLKG